jgi:aminopeptidase
VTESDQIRFAQLLLAAANLQPGQSVFVRFEPVHWPFVLVLAEEAYRQGARYVESVAEHGGMMKARVDHSQEEYLSSVPGYRAATNQRFIDENWARIVISGSEDPDLLASLDSKRVGVVRKAFAKVDLPLRQAVQSDRIRWVVTALPTPQWAAKVFDSNPDEEAVTKLWEVLKPIMRLDRDDPIREWRNHSDRMDARLATLSKLKLDSLHFSGPGTDLTVGLPAGAVWLGGGSTCQDGLWFLPNLPTEEVFTTPDFRRTTGTVALTRPALIGGVPVVGASFEFTDGRVTAWDATSGREALDEFFDIDPGARFLGEVALVDGESPIYRSGLVFHNTLLDENAASHIAFGSAYPGGVPGGDEMDEDELAAAGANSSLVHSDVMIGGPDVDVAGITADGRSVTLLGGGNWTV